MTAPLENENHLDTEVSPAVDVSGAAFDSQEAAAPDEVVAAEVRKTDDMEGGELQKTDADDDTAGRDDDSPKAPLEPFSLTFENHEPELVQAGTVVDEQGRSKGHRSFQILGVFLLVWMFGPNILKDPTDLMSWFMVLAAVGLLWLVLKYPAQINAKFAKQRAEAIPECTVEVTNEGVTVIEGPSRYEISFDGKVAAYDYMDGITIQAENNRIVCVPKKQLSEPELFSLRAALRQGLGDRFKTIETKPPQGLFGRRR